MSWHFSRGARALRFGSRRPVPTGWRCWADIESDVLDMITLAAMLGFWVCLLWLLVAGCSSRRVSFGDPDDLGYRGSRLSAPPAAATVGSVGGREGR